MPSTPKPTLRARRRAIADEIAARGVRFVRLQFVDLFGVSKMVSVPAMRLAEILDGTISFDGGSIDGFVRDEELDMLLQPDLATFAIFPWNDGQPEARLICTIAMPDGSPFEGCPRTTLQRNVERLDALVPGARIAGEVEFYLFSSREGGERGTETSDVGSYFDFSPNDRGERARDAIVSALESMGVPVSAAHHEHSPGQHEIDLALLGPLAAADAILTLRTLAKHLAPEHALEATFMPKPRESTAGSGLHLTVHLGERSDRESLLYAVGGLLAHGPALTALCNPTVNSYKRLVAAWDAPIHCVWSRRSTDAMIRVPDESAGAIELRSPDPACNPYLALAVVIAAICDGIERRTLPGEPVVHSSYSTGERERRERGIVALPKSLRQSIDALDADDCVRGAIGDHCYHALRDAKIAEYERYRRAVHDWEREAYLRRY
ncbi:MAG: glutamine synthetase [Candidatus Eremiobacteraeota bacterium]|uniref:Glutamine synthetase n=1 Tax=mine drainage metagenome TaxID=410659 RepID=E6PI82_9ZZZZ|nr:glutamine synthetase [Candidatus Eremiobacteraeota bacterium]